MSDEPFGIPKEPLPPLHSSNLLQSRVSNFLIYLALILKEVGPELRNYLISREIYPLVYLGQSVEHYFFGRYTGLRGKLLSS
jgi:hypothetical protein